MKKPIVSEHSILFLGSGFSTEAENVNGKGPPTGAGLKREIAKIVKVQPEDYSLTDLADFCAEEDQSRLFDVVQRSFRIRSVGKNQQTVLAAPWHRIYTTNFDDAAEVGRHAAGLKVSSFSFEKERPRKIPDGSIIHLHGVVRDVTEENVLEKIVLGETAYVRQHLERSPWFDQFLYDLRFCDQCFFVGYSLSDQHIAALLTMDPRQRDKIHFVEPDRIPDRIFAARVQKYGEILPIGIDGFAAEVAARKAPAPLSDFHMLKAFKLLEAQPDKRVATKPSVSEVRDLLVHGRLQIAQLASNLDGVTYVIPRRESVDLAYNALRSNKSIVIDGRLGNGKSVFEYIFFTRLATAGYTCLLVKAVSDIDPREIAFLAASKDVVLFFDNFATAQTLLEPLSASLPDAKFVVEVRTSVLDVRLFEIEAKVPRPYGRVSLNKLSDTDMAQFEQLCRSAGIVFRSRSSSPRDMRDLLIQVFESAVIKEKIQTDLEKAFKDHNAKRIVTIVFLLQLVQADIDPDFIRLVSGVDPFSALHIDAEGAEEIVSLKDGDIALRSSIFAEFAMRQFVSTRDLSDAVHDCAVFCANRRRERRYRNLLSMFMQYSRIRPMYATRPHAADELRALYERLRWYPNIAEDPLFWLQFAILEIDEKNLPDAYQHLRYAYEVAEGRPTFRTHQIDTQYLRLLIDSVLLEVNLVGSDQVAQLVSYAHKVGGMLMEESHRFFAYDQLERLPDAVRKLTPSLTPGECTELRGALSFLINLLQSTSVEFRTRTGSDQLLQKLNTSLVSLS